MIKSKLTVQNGFSSIELVVTIAITVIPILVVGFILVDSNRGWHDMYDRIHSDVAEGSYVAAKKFDALVRRASKDTVLLDGDGKWVEVYYRQDGDSTVVDRYAFFYVAGGNLMVEYGQLYPRATLTTQIVCKNVSDCVFKQVGQSIQMVLKLDDGTHANSVVSSAVMHN